jgi:hypothetical protein
VNVINVRREANSIAGIDNTIILEAVEIGQNLIAVDPLIQSAITFHIAQIRLKMHF